LSIWESQEAIINSQAFWAFETGTRGRPHGREGKYYRKTMRRLYVWEVHNKRRDERPLPATSRKYNHGKCYRNKKTSKVKPAPFDGAGNHHELFEEQTQLCKNRRNYFTEQKPSR
jgi:hypothetical protein